MRKFTRVGVYERIHEFTAQLLQMEEKNKVEVVDPDPKKFLSKTILVMGNVDVDFFKEIIARVRSVIYIGNDQEIIDVIVNYTLEKDIPLVVSNSTLSQDIRAWYNAHKTLEIYSSSIFSEMELANKYLVNTGPNFSLLVKYISQMELMRNTAVFDHDNFEELKPLYAQFNEYHDAKTNADPPELYNQEELLEIFNKYRP